jgi:GntR family transcriptional regulator
MRCPCEPASRIKARNGPQMNDELPAPEDRRHARSTREAGSAEFLYRSVKDEIRRRILTKVYPPGARIPSVDDLALEFGVSNITVRRAVRELAQGGLLSTRQGRGVFVSHQRRVERNLNLAHVIPFEQEMEASGVTASLHHLSLSLVPQTDEPFLSGVERPSRHFHKVERLLLADGEPVGFDTLWLPAWVASKLLDKLQGSFIVSQLPERGFHIEQVKFQIEATQIGEAHSSLLNIASGSPLLDIKFFPIGSKGKPILAGRMMTRADRFTYKFVTPTAAKSA